jgi:hypothetical protein
VIKPVKLSISPGWCYGTPGRGYCIALILSILLLYRGGGSSIDVFVYGTLCAIKMQKFFGNLLI